MTEKRCPTCKEIKLLDEFYKDSSRKDGHTPQCKVCRNKYKKKWRKDNPDKVNKATKRWRESHREHRVQYKKEWASKNRDRINETTRQWAKENPGKVGNYIAKRKALKKSTITDDPWELQQISIFYANCPDGYHVDHIVPLSKGGTHTLSNLQYLEIRLNLSKSDKHPSEWDDPRPISCAA